MCAEFLEKEQWKVRPEARASTAPAIRPTIGISTADFTPNELTKVLAKLKAAKAAGPDKIPPEFLKALSKSSHGAKEMLDMCNLCWQKRVTPKSWHMARVKAIFKKGDASLCANYRPISLLDLGYKIFGALVLQRLKDGKVDAYIYGQRSLGSKRALGQLMRFLLPDGFWRELGTQRMNPAYSWPLIGPGHLTQ